MKKISIALIIFAAFSCVLFGCSDKNPLSFTDEILACYQSIPLLDQSDDAIVNVTIYNNGEAVYEKITSSGSQAAIEFKIDHSDVKSIQKVMARVNFIELDEDIGVDGLDGTFEYITAYANGINRKSGGLNPTESRFTLLRDAILDVVPDSVIEECNAKLSEN